MSYIIWTIRRSICWELLFYALYQSTNLAIPILFKFLFDNLDKLSLILTGKLLLAYLILILANSGFQYLTQYYEWVVERDFQTYLRQEIFASQIRVGGPETGRLLSVFQNDISDLTSNYLEPRISIIKSSFALLSYSFVLAYVADWRITLVTFGATFLSLIIPKILGTPLTTAKEKSLLQTQIYMNQLKDWLEGRYLATTDSRPAFKDRHRKQLNTVQAYRLSYGRYQTLANVLNGLSMFFVQFASFAVVIILLYQKQLSLGGAVATFSYVNDYVYPVRYLLNDLSLMSSMRQTVVRFNDFYLKKKKEAPLSEIIPKYLKTPDFILQPGDLMALIGASGSGKSTYLDSLASGKLRLWDEDVIESFDFNSFAFYSRQQGHLFAQSFWDNVTLMGTYPRSALLDSFIQLLPSHILVSQDVTQLSGGEQQLVRLTQALNSGKTFLFLDEVLTGVDKVKSQHIMTFLKQQNHLAILMITHDTSVENLSHFSKVVNIANFVSN